MAPTLYIFFGLAGLGLVIGLIWRIVSSRQSLPCPSWLGWMVELDNPFTKVNRAWFIVEQLKPDPAMKVLDAGCGPGRVTLPLADAVGPQGEVLAMDIQDGMLARVSEKVQAANLQNVHYLQAGLGEGQLPQAYFDRAVLVTVLGEIPDQVAALQEIYEALKPGGILSVTEVIFDPHFQRRETVLRAANSVGFTEIDFFGRSLAYTLHLKKSPIVS
jgi:ubiquinone/menaquinone biosynthesis C-methylase UbiE